MISRDKAPTAQETFMQMTQAAGLRGRLLVTLGILFLIRLSYGGYILGRIDDFDFTWQIKMCRSNCCWKFGQMAVSAPKKHCLLPLLSW
ncbi:MAG: hypothetical protein F6K28_12695 [Microcoleus sp. SIO2G3]|nr:hypothetical protein [Microcoleus sp. SIO2G3]